MPKYVVDYEQFNNNFFLLLNSLIFCLRQIFFSAFPRDGIFYFFFWEFFFFGGFFQLFFWFKDKKSELLQKYILFGHHKNMFVWLLDAKFEGRERVQNGGPK